MKAVNGQKRCCLCRAKKPVSEFYKAPDRPDGLRPSCKACRWEEQKLQRATPSGRKNTLAAMKKWRDANPDRIREDKLIRRYGLTIEGLAAMHERQNNLCAICGQPSEKTLHIDHDANTRVVRGLLCGNHNRGLGMFQHDPALLRAAADYLEKASTRIPPGTPAREAAEAA